MIRRNAVLAAVLLAVPLRPAAAEEPKRSALWEANCTVCHGEDGRAQTEEGRKKKARNLADPRWQESVSDDRLLRSITRGREDMPSFGRKLSEEQIKALIAEIRSFVPKK